MLYWLQDFRADESCFIEEENRGVYNVIFLWEALEMKLRTKLVIVFLAVMFLTAFFTTVAMHTLHLRKRARSSSSICWSLS